MARISAKVAGFALIVLSIGFNTWRYPAVREMVGASPCVSESNELSPTALIRGPESPLEPRHGTAPTVALRRRASNRAILRRRAEPTSCRPNGIAPSRQSATAGRIAKRHRRRRRSRPADRPTRSRWGLQNAWFRLAVWSRWFVRFRRLVTRRTGPPPSRLLSMHK